MKRVISLFCALMMLFTLCACGEGSDAEDAAQNDIAGVAVQTQMVAVSDISSENKVSGMLLADSETTIMVASAAKCIAVYKQAGETVNAGDAICMLDLTGTSASYNAAQISYNSAAQGYAQQKEIFAAQIALYEKTLSNTKALYEIGAASQLEIDTALLQLLGAQAQRDSTLAQLEAGMQSYKSNLAQLKTVMENVDANGNIIAPVSGTLVSMSAVEDGFVSANMPVAVIDGVDQMKISASVSESLVPKLAIGDTVDVSVGSADVSFTGTIRSVDKTANYQTKLYGVTISIPAEVSGLLSGMFAEVTFHTETSADAVVVPSEAILTANGTEYVFIVENDCAKYTAVTTGLIGNGITEVTSGLTGGEVLVTVGQTYLSDGDAVRVVSQEG